MLKLTETVGANTREREVPLLSDGTLRVLAIAAALLSAKHDSVVVIEEIDNGIHPSRAKHLLENIYKVAQERNLRVLLTTHNPALANALPREALPDTVVCYRDPEQGDSRLVRLKDLEDHEYLRLTLQGRLGTLMTTGELEKFMKQPKRTLEEETAEALAFFETMWAETPAASETPP